CATSRLRADASVTSNGRPMSDAAPSLLLASASPRRRELLGALGLTFRVAPAHLDEAALGAVPPPAAPGRPGWARAAGLTVLGPPADLDAAALGAGLRPERAALVVASAKAAAI